MWDPNLRLRHECTEVCLVRRDRPLNALLYGVKLSQVPKSPSRQHTTHMAAVGFESNLEILSLRSQLVQDGLVNP